MPRQIVERELYPVTIDRDGRAHRLKQIPEPRMDAKAVGDAVAYMANLPLDANVPFLTIMATKMPFIGRG